MTCPEPSLSLRLYPNMGIECSATQGSPELTLNATAHPFCPGAPVIVTTQCRRGVWTDGLGGTWPKLSEATDAAVLASAPAPANVHTFARDSGQVYVSDGQSWTAIGPSHSGGYYRSAVIPLALVARVLRVNGRTVTLDRPAVQSASGASIYHDCSPMLEPLVGTEVVVPPGEWMLGRRLNVRGRTGITLRGHGTSSVLRAAPGCHSAGPRYLSCHGLTVQDLTIDGGHNPEGGYFHGGSLNAWAIHERADALRIEISNNVTVRNVVVRNPYTGGIHLVGGTNCWAEDCRVEEPRPKYNYLSHWSFAVAAGVGGGFRRCTYDSPYRGCGFETFHSVNVLFEDITNRNGTISTNGSTDWTIRRLTAVIEEGCAQYQGVTLQAQSPIGQVVDIGMNAPGATPQGGLLEDFAITIEGEALPGVIVHPDYHGWPLAGITLRAHPYMDAALPGPVIRDGAITYVGTPRPSCRSFYGGIDDHQATALENVSTNVPILTYRGSVTGCAAPRVDYCGTRVSLAGNNIDATTDLCA